MIMNMNEKGRQTKLLAAIAVLAMVVCALAVIVPADDASATPGTPSGGSVTIKTAEDLAEVLEGIGAEGEYKDVDTIILTSDIVIPTSLTIDKNVTIKSEEGQNYTITLGSRMTVSSNVTFEDLTISTTVTGNMIFVVFKARSLGEDVTLTFNNVVFDESTNTKKIIVDSDLNSATSHLVMDGCTTSGVSISYSKTTVSPTVEIINSAGLGLELFDKTGDGMISIGTDITTDSALGDVSIEEGTVSVKEEVTVNTITNDGRELSVSSKLTVNSGNISGTGSTIKTTSSAAIVDPEGEPIDVTTIVTDNDLTGAFAYNDVVIYGGDVSNATITIPELKTGQELRFPGDSVSNANITIKINGQTAAMLGSSVEGKKFNASGFYITSGSVKINAEEMNGPIYSGTEVVDISGKLTGNVTLGNLPDGKNSFVVPSNEKLDLNGKSLTISEDVTLKALGPITGTGSIEIQKGATLSYTEIANTVTIDNKGGTIKIEGGQGTENIISVSQSVNGTYYLTADTTIQYGVTFTVPRNAVLNLMGYDLIVEGTLVIENRGTVTNGVGAVDTVNPDDNSIILTTTGSIQNEGTIGDRMPINISNGANEAENQVVSMKGVTGVSIQLVRTIDTANSTRVYNMAVSGDISAVRGVENPKLTLTNVDINGSMTIARDISMTVDGITDVTGNGTVVTINGSMTTTGGTFTLNNGTSAVLNGHVIGKINAKVGVMNDQGQLIGSADEPAASVSFTDSADESYTVGMTISVNRVTVPQDDGTSDIYQRMFVDGAVKAANDDRTVEPESEVAFTGNVYITDSLTLTDVTVSSGSYTMMVSEGGVVETLQDDIVYNGAKYAIEADTATDPETYYYTTFDGAMQSIATAMDGIVYVNGDFTITGTYTVADNQEIAVDPNSTGIGVKVGEGSTITVELGGVVDDLAFYQILGKVVVAEGDGYAPDATYPGSSPVQYIYAVMTEDSETYDVTYSGFKTAIDEAQAGQTIEVVGNAEYDGDLVIPNGVTVQVNEGLKLTVTGDVTVENGGKLVLDASKLVVGKDKSENTVTVAGELDASEAGTISAVSGADVDIYSTGTLTSMTVVGGNGVTMNAAYYNDGGEYVYTSLANAVAYAEENALPYAVHVTGTFTETGAVESDGVDIEVDSLANVTLGDLRLNDAKIALAGSADKTKTWYTATVTALNGSGDAAVDSTVAVTKTTATVESKVTLNAEGTSQYALQIDNLAGANVQAGTVTYVSTNNIEVTKNAGLTISSGATLLIGENATLKDADGLMVNNGTFSIAKKKTLSVEGTLAGNVNVPKGATLEAKSGIIITGTVDADGKFTVTGPLQVGASPELLTDTASGAIVGEVTIGASNTDYVLAFAGADLSQADIVNASYTELKSTAYQINGIDFATVYTFGNIAIDGTHGDAVYDAVDALKDLYTPTTGTSTAPVYYDIVWYADGVEVESTDYVGDYAQVTTEIRYNSVDVTVSAGPQITISVDGVVWNGYDTLPLTIGTHTVSAVVNPGYTGTVQITFNGQTVTNGQFEITSDMMDSLDPIVLSATGNITQDSTVVIDGGNQGGSGEMGLTDYLLIILVILIVVMAIIVALRLMRS